MFMRIVTWWGLLGLGLLTARATAQVPAQAAPPAPLTLAQCYRALTPDSVVFYYDMDYALVPPGCATIRRHTRIDSAGRFHGRVQDYLLANNVLLLQGAYRHGRKEGTFELFYSDGSPAVRPRYHAGQPVGDWAYWYPSGQPRQVVQFAQPQRPTLQRFWAPDGMPLVVAGEGQWRWEEAGTRLEGLIRQGRPEGKWSRRLVRGGQPYSVEYFRQGNFSQGTIFYEPGPDEQLLPLDTEQMPFLEEEAFDQAEQLVLGQPCPVLN